MDAIQRTQLAIVGNSGGTNIGQSLYRASITANGSGLFFDAYEAWRGPRLLRKLKWNFMDRRPIRLSAFSRAVVNGCKDARPMILIATGNAPLTDSALRRLRELGIMCVNYSTDDPWNPSHRAEWYLRALKQYNLVFTPRRANIDDFLGLGCAEVRYLPFAYDDELFGPVASSPDTQPHDVLFVGGADRDRATFMSRFMRSGLVPALVGQYWGRYPEIRKSDLGIKSAGEIQLLTAAAAVNLCLVRHANRDGNVMRSFEIPAVGGFMLVEDTSEHRALFGDEGKHVLYFDTPEKAAAKAKWALANPTERRRMATQAHELIVHGKHTYRDRLLQMVVAVGEGKF
jgi:spore maturation protein CgeB